MNHENKWASRKLAAFVVSMLMLGYLVYSKADGNAFTALWTITGAYLGMQGLVDRQGQV